MFFLKTWVHQRWTTPDLPSVSLVEFTGGLKSKYHYIDYVKQLKKTKLKWFLKYFKCSNPHIPSPIGLWYKVQLLIALCWWKEGGKVMAHHPAQFTGKNLPLSPHTKARKCKNNQNLWEKRQPGYAHSSLSLLAARGAVDSFLRALSAHIQTPGLKKLCHELELWTFIYLVEIRVTIL